MPVGEQQKEQPDTLSPTSPSGSGSRSSLGLISTSVSASAASATVTNAANAGSSDDKRRRAGRRQSEDTMRAMRSLDRQYGRRRRLNTDQSLTSSSSAAALVASTNVLASGSRPPRAPQRRGDSRALFAAAPLDLSMSADTTQPSVAPTLHSPVGSVAGSSARLARQLIMIAGKLAQAPSGAVRPRASMPLIGASTAAQQQQPLQKQRSMRRKNRDELADALTMKSVEIRGGRIVLDDPSSSEEDEDEDDKDNGGYNAYGGGYARASVGSVATNGAATEAAYWEEALRRRWYARRCLGLRQPFASIHRLAQAEHTSDMPFPLLSDVRCLVHESQATIDDAERDVLVCSDALVFSSSSQDAPHPLRVIEYGDDMRVSAESDEVAVVVDEQGESTRIRFVNGGAVAWAALVEQACKRMCAAMQDLRLDEEDFVERPPASLLLMARGRSSIAGSTAATAAAALGATASSASLGHKGQPMHWVPDGETAVCMVCRQTAFSMMVRRHHCRVCGLVICYRCSNVGQDRFRMCVKCSAPNQQMHVQRRAGSLGAAFMSAAAAMSTAVSGPKPSPSLHTLGRRAAEYMPSGDVVMQAVAAQRKPDSRLTRRPLSSLFPVDGVEDTN